MTSPSQGLSDKHSPLGTKDEVAPGAEEVVAVEWVYATAALCFGACTAAEELRLSIGATHAEASNVVGVIYVEGDAHRS